jgi:ABC-type sugar transport system substrate-binding protein
MGKQLIRRACQSAAVTVVAIAGVATAGFAVLAAGTSAASTTAHSRGASISTRVSSLSKISGKKIAYIEIFLQAPIDLRTNQVFTMAAHDVGWSVTTTDADGNGQTVSAQMQAAVNDNVSAIVTDADPSLIRSGLIAARAKHIPVISIGGENTHNLDHLESGVYTESDKALTLPLGKLMCSQIKRGSEVAILRFDLFASGLIRGNTIEQQAKACGLKVVAQPSTQQTFSSAEANTSAILNANPKLAAIVPVYDTFTAGAVQAIKSAHASTKVYSFYADTVNNPLMRANPKIVAGLTDATTAAGAPYAVDRLLAYFAKGTKIPHSVPKGFYTYKVITPSGLPPAGQNGPEPLADYIKPYLLKWKSEYGIG